MWQLIAGIEHSQKMQNGPSIYENVLCHLEEFQVFFFLQLGAGIQHAHKKAVVY